MVECATDPGHIEGSDAEIASVVVQWQGSDGTSTFSTIELDEESKCSTLACFKVLCAKALGVELVQLPDFNEDMDETPIAELGIGFTDVPILLDLGTSEVTEHRLHAEIVDTDGLEKAKAKVSPKADSKPSFSARKALEDASEIKDGWLFLSGQLAATNLECLQRLGITHVLNCCERIPCKFKSRLTYRTIAVLDTKASHIPEALAFIDEAQTTNGKVLVHCMVGASRSVSLVLAWLVARCSMSLKEAFLLVRKARHQARPNRSFCEQLMLFETETRGSSSTTLADFFHT